MSEINTGGPAFPVPGMSGLPNSECIWPEHGMTLRNYFAAKAMQGQIAGVGGIENTGRSICEVVAVSYAMADAMLAAREKGGAA